MTVDPEDPTSLDPYQDSDEFTIDARSGQISVASGTTLDFENPTGGSGNNATAYVVTVTATDPSGASDTVVVTINVTDVDESPVFAESPETVNPTEVSTAEVSTAEDQTGGPLSQAYTAVDPEDDTSITWSVSDTDNFSIGANGTLAFAEGVTPDHEKQSEYVITITARGTTSDAGTASDSIEVTVTIDDVAEGGEVELSARQPQIGKAVTAELDEMDDNPTGIQWRWGTVASTEECTPTVFQDDDGPVAPAMSYTPVAVDAEMRLCAQASYFDDAEPADADDPMRDTAVGISDAVIEMRPTSNAAPEFGDVDPIEIDEGTTSGVGDSAVTAMDSDDDDLLYSLEGPDAASFDIDERGDGEGQISVAAGVDLDFENPADVGGTAGDNEYVVMVKATDPSGASDTVMVTITVTNVNEGPVLNTAPEFDAETAEQSVDENTAAGENIGDPIMATDGDTGDSLTYSLDAMGDMYFDIDSATGQLMTEADLDHETQDSYSVTVTAMDRGRLTDTMSVTVTVNDVNEAPTFDAESAELSVDENTEAGMAIGDPIAAMDVDDGDSLMYSLDEMGEMYFDIDSATGQLMTEAPLDFEERAMYMVTVTATDSGGMMDTIDVTIMVTDVPETPVFDAETADRMAYENMPVGTAVGDPVTAMLGVGYSISESMYFGIDEMSGQISTTMRLDYEATMSETVTVTAIGVEGDTDTIEVTIMVGDMYPGCTVAVNDCRTNDCEALLGGMEEPDGGRRDQDVELVGGYSHRGLGRREKNFRVRASRMVVPPWRD